MADLPHIEDLAIASFVGPLAFSRGRDYARRDLVRTLRWNAQAEQLTAEVQGTEPRPYRCTVELEGARTDRIDILRSHCSCPVTYACKHAAAALLAASARHAASARSSAGPAGWRRDLEALTTGSAPAPSARPLALQLGFTGARGRAREVLVARPVTRGARGGWIKGDLDWQNVGYRGEAGGYDPAQTRWFRELWALRGGSSYLSHTSDKLTLDDFDSALLWAVLDRAAALGIELVASEAGTVIEIGTAASPQLDMTDDGSGLTLTPVVLIDGRAHPASHARPIGTHGVCAREPGRLVLAAWARPLTPDQRAALTGRPVHVPAADRAEFLTEHYAALARAVRITSSDDSAPPPDVPPATLVLTAAFGRAHTLALAWHWEHADRTRSPLGAPGSAFADPAERDVALELAVLLATHPAGEPAVADGELVESVTLQGIETAEFAAQVLPLIEQTERVRLDIVGERPDYRELPERPTLAVTAFESEQNDWFDLGVTVTVAGRTVPFGPLFEALSRGRTKLLLVDNSYLSLQQPVFEPLLELIEEAGTLAEWETGLRISRHQASLWSEFEDLADESEAAVAWRETVDGLRAGTTVETIPQPEGFAGELRPYQREGLSWLAFLHRHGLGGILADDMGLGKTAQTLALVAHAVSTGATGVRRGSTGGSTPFLVVAPTSVVSNWVSEAARFVPGLTVASVTATERKRRVPLAEQIAGADIVVTTYAVLRIDVGAFAALDWGGLVLDEAQFVKNGASKAHAAARDIRAPFRLAVTGTPIENNLGELWALLQIVAPGLFPSRRAFDERFRRPIENDRNAERLARLRRRIRPLMLRRTKDMVAPELPPKQEQVLEIDLDPKHRRLYDAFLQKERQKLLGLIDDLDRNRFIVFRSLTLLRMLALDATLIDAEAYAGMRSAKLDALMEQLGEVLAEGHKALVFSQFTSYLEKVAARLEEAGVPFAYLDGSTRGRDRVIAHFREGEAPVFLISLKAGGFGLNLTAADYVFLLDPWWNPASESQAVDRTHRIGQTRKVNVYRLVARDTIEEKVMALKAKKAELVAGVLDDEGLFSEAMTAEDIRGLLEH